ncbi:MAG: hypothetical protein DRO73_00150 [Candidatus Thorarchaeota archaeon]|nr:MAG: hypothetical protein DRO73_00150 [Candidatus Thorarchaeota archaeon]RLI53963.1 MAG: hypothetical protein DRO93_13120 [Candidatus Thorarchaeota archaeon]
MYAGDLQRYNYNTTEVLTALIATAELKDLNKQKALKRELTRLRKTQNPSAIDFRRMRRLRRARTTYWALLKKKHRLSEEVSVREKKEKKPKKEKKKKVKEPELEEIEPELEAIQDTDIDDLYAFDADEFDEDSEEESEESTT